MMLSARHLWRALSLTLCSVIGAGYVAQAQAQSAEPVVQQANLVYQGSFLVPNTSSSSGATFSNGGSALAYNAANNSLYLIGQPSGQLSAEISIPNIVDSTDVKSLASATFLQAFTDPTEGLLHLINPQNMNAQIIGGQLVYNGSLILGAYSYYDGLVSQSSSHFVRPLNLSTTGQVRGPFTVGTTYPGYVGGYMTEVPDEWQAAFGGPVFTGNCCVPGASWESEGPALSVFDPATLGVTNPAPATQLIGYPLAHALGGGWNTQNPYFNGSTRVTAVIFPQGTRSVLFFGRHGVGPFCYGIGTSDAALNNTLVPGTSTDVKYCYDPAESGSKGTHGYPYVYQVWAYDANDLLAVKNGTKLPYEVTPTVWTYNLPFEVAGSEHLIGGAAYDPGTQRIYISQIGTGPNYTPIIHVFKIDLTLSPPTVPRNVTVH
jgi:hypothetical protein